MNPLRDTPSEVTAALLRWGGKNPWGEPNWRVIRAENHLVQRAGMWTEFEEDTEMVHFETVGNQVRYQTRQIAPTAIHYGVRWVPLYQVEGWILERWYPAETYGDREQWEAALSQDGETPMMGPFPDRGGYFMPSGAGPWEEIPLLDSLREVIAVWENSAHLHGRLDIEELNRAMRAESERQAELEERQYDAFLEEVRYQRETHLEFVKNNPALAGVRNRIAREHGIASHQ